MVPKELLVRFLSLTWWCLKLPSYYIVVYVLLRHEKAERYKPKSRTMSHPLIFLKKYGIHLVDLFIPTIHLSIFCQGSVLALEDSALDIDQVENLIKFCPTKEEIELLKVIKLALRFSHKILYILMLLFLLCWTWLAFSLQGYNGEKDRLGKCEQVTFHPSAHQYSQC